MTGSGPAHGAPFGGFKESGIGRENGRFNEAAHHIGRSAVRQLATFM
jgi:acyl-CoA reductase-like NAD-dependent aldehyde dehydrogenase